MPIHPTAIVDAKAEIHDSATIGPFCVIDAHVRLHAGCRLYQSVYLTGHTEIGPDCEIHPFAIVGHTPQDFHYGGARSYCRVGRGTIIREHVTIHRGTQEESTTVVGEDCFLLAGSHVAHNCVVGNRVTLINDAKLAGHVEIADGAVVSGGVVIHQFVRVGQLAMLAGNARVVMDIVPFALVNPDGRIAGINRIGLRRAGYTAQDLVAIREAYRLLFDRSGSGEERPDAAAVEANPSGAAVLAFARAESRRGLAGRSR